MPNKVYSIVVSELETVLGDILAAGITKKAIVSMGYDPDSIGPDEMKKALRGHIQNSLGSFMAPDKSKAFIKKIEKRLDEVNT